MSLKLGLDVRQMMLLDMWERKRVEVELLKPFDPKNDVPLTVWWHMKQELLFEFKKIRKRIENGEFGFCITCSVEFDEGWLENNFRNVRCDSCYKLHKEAPISRN